MTLHELLKVVSDILTPDSGLLYDYMLYISDDNGGFLRTRFCWWPEREVIDKELSGEKNVILIAMASEMDVKILQDKNQTPLKLQIHYSNGNAKLEYAKWDASMMNVLLYTLWNKGESEFDTCRNPVK
jgi:hypothetical protein